MLDDTYGGIIFAGIGAAFAILVLFFTFLRPFKDYIAENKAPRREIDVSDSVSKSSKFGILTLFDKFRHSNLISETARGINMNTNNRVEIDALLGNKKADVFEIDALLPSARN